MKAEAGTSAKHSPRPRALAKRARGAPPKASDSPAVLSGVGPVRAAALEKLGLTTLRDLLLFQPRQVEPFPAAQSIASLAGIELSSIVRLGGKVARRSFSRFGRRSLLRVALDDGSGRLDVLFFNQAWLRERFQVGESIEVLGRLVDAGAKALTCQRLGTAADPLPEAGKLVAEYPAAEGLSQAFLGELCRSSP